MADSVEKRYSPKEVARMLDVSVSTLQRWDIDGKFKAHRTLTNRRYYLYDECLEFKAVFEKEMEEKLRAKAEA